MTSASPIRRCDRSTTLLIAFFIAAWIAGAVTSRGFLEDDAWTHYLYAKFAITQPAYFLDEWGRPICTGLYALPAAIGGVTGVRIASLAIVGVLTWLTARVARRLELPTSATIAFLLGEPTLYLHSLSAMTELPFALLMLAGFDAAIRRRWWWATAWIALLPLTRPEGFGCVAVMAAMLLLARRWLALPLLVVPLVAWNLLGWIAWGRPADEAWWRWLIDHWPWSAASAYGHGSILQFLVLLPVLLGAGLPFAIAGVRTIASLMSGRSPNSPDETGAAPRRDILNADRLATLFIAAIPLGVLLVHSVLWWAGRMASFGEVRYLLIAAPFWAMLAATGWAALGRIGKPALLAAVSIAIITSFKVTTLRATPEAVVAQQVVDWYRSDPAIAARWPIVIASHPAVVVLLGVTPNDGRHADGRPRRSRLRGRMRSSSGIRSAGRSTLIRRAWPMWRRWRRWGGR